MNPCSLTIHTSKFMILQLTTILTPTKKEDKLTTIKKNSTTNSNLKPRHLSGNSKGS